MSNPLKLTFKKKAPKKLIKMKKKLSKPKPIEPSETFVLIDGSYLIFRRYCATKVWYSRHTSNGDEDDCHINNADFVEKFTKHFGNWMKAIHKQFKPDQIFWFKDPPKEAVWRTPIFEGYKGHREGLAPPHIGEFFRYCYEELIPKERVILVGTAEADDSVAISTRYENQHHPQRKIVIFTGDSDYLQLVNEKTRVVNFKGPKLVDTPLQIVTHTVNKKKIKEDVDAETYLMVKILIGDKTDGIPGVPGCGPITAYKLATDPDYFQTYIMDNPDNRKIYEHNRRMISFNEIPNELQAEIKATYLDIRSQF